MEKPKLAFWEIWNMSVGFLGIQMGFALQNANASRILQSFGADVHHLSLFWLVAPVTGMIIQPIIGYYSDRTWTRLGRRRPFFLVGALLAAAGLVLMPNSAMFTHIMPSIWIGAGMLMIMDASFNVAMEPFRALVADKLPTDQRTLGYSLQTVLIGIGAVIGSWLPYVLGNWFGIEMNASEGNIPFNVILSFIIGAIFIVSTVVWTILKTPEYPPEMVAQFEGGDVFEEKNNDLGQIVKDFLNMPKAMKQLGIVQFFSWFALFSMWVFSTAAVAQHIYGLPASDSSSPTFQEAGNWIGILFGIYNAVSAVYAFFLPTIAAKFGRKQTHAFSLFCGGIGMISMYFFTTPNLLIISMIGVGIAWASILAMPYAILAGSIPVRKMGVYMGIFNFFITFPQIVNGIFGGQMVKHLYNDQAIFALVTAGVCLLIASASVRFVDDVDDTVANN